MAASSCPSSVSPPSVWAATGAGAEKLKQSNKGSSAASRESTLGDLIGP